MQLLEIIQKIEGPSGKKRFSAITQLLADTGIEYSTHAYATGKNIIAKGDGGKPVLGLSSHFDVVPGSYGANDNASSVAVCLYTLNRYKTHRFKNFALDVFIFDEEENHLQGSAAYVAEKGVANMLGLINLEMVGQGDRFALWPLTAKNTGPIMETLEAVAAEQQIFTGRFDKLVTNYADHGSFLDAGLTDVFSVTCISMGDLIVAGEFYAQQAAGASYSTLSAIIEKAPLFKHYHKPTDLSIHLSETSLQATARLVWDTLLRLDEKGALPEK